MGVDVEAVAAQEADQRHAEPLGGLDREVATAPRRRQTIGMPATAAFWTISKLTRPQTSRIRSWSGSAPRQDLRRRPACRARCGGRRPRAARPGRRSASNRPAAWSPPVASNTRLGRAEASGRARMTAARDDRAGRDRVAAHLDLVERRLAADPARRRRDEVALGDPRRVERRAPRWTVTSSSGWRMRRRVAERRRATTSGAVDQPLGPQEPDRQLVLVARGPHRDGDRRRVLAGSAGPDLQRLLARQPVLADLERPPRTATTRACAASRGVGSGAIGVSPDRLVMAGLYPPSRSGGP